MKSSTNGATNLSGAPRLFQAANGVDPGANVTGGSPLISTEVQRLERLIGKREVMDRVGLGFTSIWKLMCEGKFPRSRELGRNKVAWIEREIDEFIRTRPVRRLKGDCANRSSGDSDRLNTRWKNRI